MGWIQRPDREFRSTRGRCGEGLREAIGNISKIGNSSCSPKPYGARSLEALREVPRRAERPSTRPALRREPCLRKPTADASPAWRQGVPPSVGPGCVTGTGCPGGHRRPAKSNLTEARMAGTGDWCRRCRREKSGEIANLGSAPESAIGIIRGRLARIIHQAWRHGCNRLPADHFGTNRPETLCGCHPERSEGPGRILRSAQNDKLSERIIRARAAITNPAGNLPRCFACGRWAGGGSRPRGPSWTWPCSRGARRGRRGGRP